MTTRNSKSKKGSNKNYDYTRMSEFIPICKKKKPGRKRAPKSRIMEQFEDFNFFPNIPVKQAQKDNYLGDIRVGTFDKKLPKSIHAFEIGFNKDFDDNNKFVLKINNTIHVIQVLEDSIIQLIYDLVKSKVFPLEVSVEEEFIYFHIYLESIPLPKCTHHIEKCIRIIFKIFYNILEETNYKEKLQDHSNDDLNLVYEKLIEERPKLKFEPINKILLDSLKASLRPYQELAVQWMIHKETEEIDSKEIVNPLYEKITLKSGKIVYYDNFNCWLEAEAPKYKNSMKGGILGDEMGLGKTVEVLALILCHRFNNGIIEEIEELDNAELAIEIQDRKRKLPRLKINKEISPSKKLKKNQIKEKIKTTKKAKKSATFQALQSIYERQLSEYSTVGKINTPKVKLIQCICGGLERTDIVECVDCSKMQHSTCLGYKNSTLGPFKCPQCWEKSDKIQSKATLIVVPMALKEQWCQEMKTHLKPKFKILYYEGYSATPVYPYDLQNYDIVITTYSVLQAEMKLLETGTIVLNLRNKQRYNPTYSPLDRIFWWRLCLDEAQTVESPNRLVSMMAKKLSAQNRWAVTGTPMAKGVSDIFGLIDYLQIEPYNEPDTWKTVLYHPYLKDDKKPMYNLLSKILWRTVKSSVLDQINIPKETHKVYALEFSAVERFFYNREHDICGRNFIEIASKFDENLPLTKLDRRDLKKLMAPLFSLRKACSDSNTVRGKGRYLAIKKKKTSSMKDLLDALILKNKNDCEDTLRAIVSSINGLAGIFLLMGDKNQAITEYRKVLHLASKFNQDDKEDGTKPSIDKLLLIHAMHNLGNTLKYFKSHGNTLRDKTLLQDCAELEKNYIQKFMKESATSRSCYRTVTETIEKLNNEFMLDNGEWYTNGFKWICINKFENDLYAKLDLLACNNNVAFNRRQMLENSRAFLPQLCSWDLNLNKSREILFLALDALYEVNFENQQIIIADDIVEKAMQCHLRPESKNTKTNNNCPLCVANKHLKKYESQLYTMKNRSVNYEEMCLIGSWKPKIEELFLRSLLGLIKSRYSTIPEPDDDSEAIEEYKSLSNFVKDGENHILIIEAFKKEFKEVRKFWTLLDKQICAEDELDICKLTLQIKPESKKNEIRIPKNVRMLTERKSVIKDSINLISLAEISQQEFLLRSEENLHNSRLEEMLGKRNYLKTLRQQQFEGCTPDPCPICRGPLKITWIILPCAHTYCVDCFQNLINKNESVSITCCICRSKQLLKDIAYIRENTRNELNEKSSDCEKNINDSDEPVEFVGNYSNKFEEVVKLILKLKINDPYVKIILFSQWSEILKLIQEALKENLIQFELVNAVNKAFQTNITKFKNSNNISVLLIPIGLGSKGLNLIEASHVILLEPLLNPAEELQAIGRIHRIGQTKPTFVHQFFIKNTVEESIYNSTTSNAAEWKKHNVTIGQLAMLFKNVKKDNINNDGENNSEQQQEN